MKWSRAALWEMRICSLADHPEDGLCWPESSHSCCEYSAVAVMQLRVFTIFSLSGCAV